MELTQEQKLTVAEYVDNGMDKDAAINLALGGFEDPFQNDNVQVTESEATKPEEPVIPAYPDIKEEDNKPSPSVGLADPVKHSRTPAKRQTTNVVVSGYTREQIETIKNTVAKGATDSELQMFMHVAQTYGLDPFLKEIYYSNQIHAIITSRDGYLKAAQRDPEFEGIQSMAVCENDDFAIDAIGCSVKHSFGKGTRGDVIGAWAICYRAGRKPVIAYASYDEYNQGNQIWKKYKSAMCCKVAEVFALKRQFGISGLVTVEEIGVE